MMAVALIEIPTQAMVVRSRPPGRRAPAGPVAEAVPVRTAD